MKKYPTRTNFVLATLLLTLALPCIALAAPRGPLEPSDESILNTNPASQTSPSMFPLAIGPGLDNLSLSNRYATYQWGLKNDGEFRLVTMTSSFRSLDSVYGDRKGRTPSISLPDLGPGMIEHQSTITTAAAGIDINILPAWNQYDETPPDQKRPVIVAVIDTGIDYSHPELAQAMWTNPGEIPGDGIDNDGNGFIDDVHGWNFYTGSPSLYSGTEDSHGTHTAGTIAAARAFGNVTGITDNHYVKLMCLKALGGPYGIGSPGTVVQAIHYAEANGASICNLSLGSSVFNEELAQAIQNSNMLFIIACGNGGADGNGYDIDAAPIYPAALPYDNVISVASLQFDGNLAPSSNYGALSVDIAAPGSYILSTVPGNNYAFMSGTSMAAPMVTGVAAMVYSCRTDLSLSDIKTALLSTARPLESLTGKMVSGGLVDAHAALNYGLTADVLP